MTAAEVLERLTWSISANPAPDDGSQPERRQSEEAHRRRNEQILRQVRELIATMQPGDELRFYDDWNEWSGLALVRSDVVVGHVPYHESYTPNCYYELIVHFAGPRASAKELMALRKLDPTLRDTALQTLVELVGDSPKWTLGRYYIYNVEDTERQCRELGLRTERI
jgi:hypothetical protein